MKKGTAIPGNENIVTVCLLFFSFFIISMGGTSAFALDIMGPPVTNLKQTQFQTAFEYSQSTMKLQFVNGIYSDTVVGDSFDSGDVPDLEITDFETSRIYSYFGYSFAYNCEGFVLLGTTSSEFNDLLTTQSDKFKSDDTPVVGGGLKVTLYDDYRLRFGGIVQANWVNYNGQYKTSTSDTHYVGIDIKEVQIALGAIYKWTDYISVYGGPVYHYITGDYDDVFTTIDEDTGKLEILDYKADIENSSNYGGYMGTQIELTKKLSFNFEYQVAGSDDAFGANMVLRF